MPLRNPTHFNQILQQQSTWHNPPPHPRVRRQPHTCLLRMINAGGSELAKMTYCRSTTSCHRFEPFKPSELRSDDIQLLLYRSCSQAQQPQKNTPGPPSLLPPPPKTHATDHTRAERASRTFSNRTLCCRPVVAWDLLTPDP